MALSRRTVLTALLAAVAAVAAAILSGVLGTVFFAVTVAYVLVPFERWLRRRGLPAWWASAAATAAAFLAVVVLLLPIGALLYLRRRELLSFLATMPDHLSVSVLGFVYTVDAGTVASLASSYLTRAAITTARTAPVLGIKATVFGFVVFALLLRRDRVRRALLAPIDEGYHDVVGAIHERIRQTLFALYVIQAATAFGTFLVALPVFWLFGYRLPIALAVTAGVLQFLPVVGPSILIVGLAAVEMVAGAYADAALLLAVGLVLVGFLPDAVLRPRLARETAKLPASLYFVGFAGGLLSLGPVGIIAGPLVVALLAEALSLLGEEVTQPRRGDRPDDAAS